MLPAELSAAVREICRQEHVTPFMLLLAAWATVLGRHSGQDDVLVGRIRRNLSDPSGHSISMFVAADQLLKGAALNAIQIAELLPQRAMA